MLWQTPCLIFRLQAILVAKLLVPISAQQVPTSNQTAATDDEEAPLLKAICSSRFLARGSSVQLTPGLEFHWKVVQKEEQKDVATSSTLTAVLRYDRQVWLGLGWNSANEMLGATAVIGEPSLTSTVTTTSIPSLYNLTSSSSTTGNEQGAVVTTAAGRWAARLPDAQQQSLVGAAMTTDPDGPTTLRFSLQLNDDAVATDIHVDEITPTTFLFAAGDSFQQGYHRHRGVFRLHLQECETAALRKHQGVFAVHAALAITAVCIALPTAVSSAWFRSLIPTQWVYVHVVSNLIGLVLLFAVVVMGFTGVALRKDDGYTESGHMTRVHHWMGVLLFLVAAFQVLNGFRRPSVDPKSVESEVEPVHRHQHTNNLFRSQSPTRRSRWSPPKTARELWHWFHCVTALFVGIVSIYQVHSGIQLFAGHYNNGESSTATALFWCYGITLVFSLGPFKLILERRKRQATTNFVSVPAVSLPGRGRDDIGHDETQGLTKSGRMEFSVI